MTNLVGEIDVVGLYQNDVTVFDETAATQDALLLKLFPRRYNKNVTVNLNKPCFSISNFERQKFWTGS